MQKQPGPSSNSNDKQVRQLSKGAQQIAHDMVLMREETARLRDAIKGVTKRKSRKRRYKRIEETLTAGEVTDLVTIKEGGSRNDSEKPTKRVRGERHCCRCGETGHNSLTCEVEFEDIDDSEASEQCYSILYNTINCCRVV
jgi:hypothetical protein